MIKRITAAIFSVILLFTLYSPIASATESQRIRVGVSEMHGYFERTSSGEFTGMLYEYLEEISKYSNFDCRYVIADNQTLQKMLKNKEIDLISGSFRTPTLEDEFLFSNHSTGYVNATLNTSTENTKISLHNPSTLDGITIGAYGIPDNYLESLKKYLNANQASYNLLFYNNKIDLIVALNNKTVDAIVNLDAQTLPKQQVAAIFDKQPLYPITYKGNTALMNQLNSALERIDITYPDYDRLLYDKFVEWRQSSNLVLNKYEEEYIKNADVIDVAIYPIVEPLQYFNEDKQFSGIVADVYKLVSENTGLQFRFTPMSSYENYLQAIKQGNFSMVCTKNRYVDSKLSEIIEPTWPYLTTNNVIVKNASMSTVSKRNIVQASVYSSSYPKVYSHVKHIYFNSFDECLSAVNSGVADIAIANSTVVEYKTQQKVYRNITLETLPQSEYDLCLGVTKPIDSELLAIINKTLYNISELQMKDIYQANTIVRKTNFGLIDYFSQNPARSIIILTSFFAILAFLLLVIVKIKLDHAQRLYQLANIDSITGASTTAKFKADAQKALKENKSHAMIAIDIKKFTIINDMFGHAKGDKLLQDIADLLRHHLSTDEYFTRMNADIFYMLIIYESDEKLMKFMKLIEDNVFVLIEGYMVEMSYGIYVIPDDFSNVDIICDRTNLACRAAKEKLDPNYFFFNDDLRNAILAEQEMANMADDALQNGEFQLYLQPQHLFKSGQPIGAEALVRWQSSSKGFIMPDNFIPLFEKNGFIKKLDKHMFTAVCHYLHDMKVAFPNVPPPIISVNFSRLHFSNLALADELLAIANEHLVDPNLLEIELTESAVYYNEEHFITIIQSLKRAGFRLALDDFGTGYSSLNTLKDLPVDTIKLDKGFLDKSTDTSRGQNIIMCLIILAKAVNLSTVVEGVETQEQVDFLTGIGCDIAQGYFYAKPMPDSEFLAYWHTLSAED